MKAHVSKQDPGRYLGVVVHGIGEALAWLWWHLVAHWFALVVLGLFALAGLVMLRLFSSVTETVHGFVDVTAGATVLYGGRPSPAAFAPCMAGHVTILEVVGLMADSCTPTFGWVGRHGRLYRMVALTLCLWWDCSWHVALLPS